MIYYLSFYLFVLFGGSLFSLYRSKVFLYVVLFGAVIFSGFRYDAGNDFFSYMDILTGEKDYQRIEYLTSRLIDVAIYLESPYLFYLVTSFIYIAAVSYALFRSGTVGFSSVFLLLFFTASWLTSFGYIRQYVAISFVFLGFVFLFERKFARYLLFTAIACLFHKSAISSFVALPFYILYAQKERGAVSHVAVLIAAFVSTELFVFFIKYFDLFSHYILYPSSGFGGGIFLVLLFVFSVNFCVAKVYKLRDKKFWVFSSMFFFGILLYAALLGFGEYVVRVAYYFVPFFYASSFLLLRSLTGVAKLFLLLFYISISTFTYFYALYLASVNESRDFLTNYEFYLFF